MAEALSRDLLAWSGRPFLAKYRDHPVTNVELKDATAYCGWRGVRLPTGDEWEVAARGEPAFHYPWGNQFDPAKCNASESGRGRTTRVDEHPAGTSPTGCWDMGGNVQEWVAADGGGQPTVRGGSFAVTGNLHALTFLYIHADADVARPYIGFRYVHRERGGAA